MEFIIAVDVGSPRCDRNPPSGNLGWYSSDDNSGYAADFAKQIASKDYFAIGLEAPLFIPANSFPQFTAARNFDGCRAWSASAGAYVTAINLPFLTLCLRTISKGNPDIEITTDLTYWRSKQEKCVLFWEAFIYGQTKNDIPVIPLKSDDLHIRDAELACKLFVKGLATEINLQTPNQNLINLPRAFSLNEGLRFAGTETKGLLVKSERPSIPEVT